MNNTQPRFKNVCFKNISFGIAALIAAIGYSVERIDHCYREHVNQMRSGFFFAVKVERQLKVLGDEVAAAMSRTRARPMTSTSKSLFPGIQTAPRTDGPDRRIM